MHCGMQFLFVKISALPCILNGVGIAVPLITRSPNSNQNCLTGVSQYGPVFDGLFITAPKNVSKNSFPQIFRQTVCRIQRTTQNNTY